MPIPSISLLYEALKKVEEMEKGSVIVFMGCGGNINLSERLEKSLSEGKEFCFLLMDHHRPLHHLNLIPNKDLLVVDDGRLDIESCPTEDEIVMIEEQELKDEDQSDEQKTPSNEDLDNQSTSKHRKKAYKIASTLNSG